MLIDVKTAKDVEIKVIDADGEEYVESSVTQGAEYIFKNNLVMVVYVKAIGDNPELEFSYGSQEEGDTSSSSGDNDNISWVTEYFKYGDQEVKERNKKKSKMNTIIIVTVIVAIILVIVGIVIAVYFIKKNKANTQAKNE